MFMPIILSCLRSLFCLHFFMQVETLAEAGSYEDALSLCAMCKVRGGAVVVVVAVDKGLPTTHCYLRQAVLDARRGL